MSDNLTRKYRTHSTDINILNKDSTYIVHILLINIVRNKGQQKYMMWDTFTASK